MAELISKHIREIALSHADSEVAARFLERLESDPTRTRDENPYTHFCVYFAAYDPKAKQVFLGLHKKSGHWLFNGGHIDKGEIPLQALEREIGEEWGLEIKSSEVGSPKLLTITEINNPTKQTCTKHYDIWYFVPVSKDTFMPDQALLATEFDFPDWLSISEAKEKTKDPNTQIALNKFEEIFARI